MAKQESIEVTGTVKVALPNAMFRVELTGGQTILAHISGKIRLHNIKISAGDEVLIEMSPYDVTKGRIIYRYK